MATITVTSTVHPSAILPGYRALHRVNFDRVGRARMLVMEKDGNLLFNPPFSGQGGKWPRE